MTKTMTKDDVINSEIEQERNKNVSVDVSFAPEDAQKEFDKKMKDENYFAVEITATLKLVEFVDISEFNSQIVKGGEYKEKFAEFIRSHKRFNSAELRQKLTSLFKESGLYLTYLSSIGRPYNPNKSTLEALTDILSCGSSDCSEKILKAITPPSRH